MRRLLYATIMSLCFLPIHSHSKDYLIFSVLQEVPMTYEVYDSSKKNYLVNIGQEQGVNAGSILNVYRTISEIDPYENKKRYDFKVKVGELEIVHTEKTASLTKIKQSLFDQSGASFELKDFLVGDKVEIKVK